MFFYELDHAGDLFRFWRDWIKDAPETYGGFPAFQIAPPLPFVPEDRHGDTFASRWCTSPARSRQGEAAMAPFRDLAPRVGEMVAPMPYPWLNSAFDAIFPKGIRSYWKGNYVTELTDAAIERTWSTVRRCPRSAPPCTCTRSTAPPHRVAADETAFAYRHATFAHRLSSPHGTTRPTTTRGSSGCATTTTPPPRTPSQAATSTSWHDDDHGRIQDNYLDNYTRLVDVKRIYDPDNLFHHNQNIRP